jgi:hypothetical protein
MVSQADQTVTRSRMPLRRGAVFIEKNRIAIA